MRQAARDAVAAYHEANLASLIAHVGRAIDGFRASTLDPFAVDQVLFQYSRSAKELWRFCNLIDVGVTAQTIGDQPPIDWWKRGAPKRRRRQS